MDSLQQVWDAACELIKEKISTVAFSTWIGVITPISLEDDRLFLSVSSDFRKKIIETNYTKTIEQAFSEVMGFPVVLELRSEQEAEHAGNQNPTDDLFTFDTFVVAGSNSFAFAAAKAVAKNPGKGYNPLFIYGDSGLGKTHLLTAVKKTVEANFPNYNVISVQGEDFLNEFIASLSSPHNAAEFRRKFRTCDMLILDDVQFIGDKVGVQEEFFHTFEALHRAGKQIVLASDRPPKAILSLDSRLRTRFETGLADIGAPDYETRVAILRKKAELCDFDIPDAVINYLAEKIKFNNRQLVAAVTKLNAKYIMNGQAPTLALAVETCKDIISDTAAAVTPEVVKEEVARVYQISPSDLSSGRQDAQISLVRQVAMYVTRELIPMTLKEIGDNFGGRHYTTVHYAIDSVEKSIKTNQHLRETVEDIIKNIKSKD